MRVALTLLIGGVVTAGCVVVGVNDDGSVGGAAWILAMFLAIVTVGLATAALVDGWVDRPVINPNMPPPVKVKQQRRTHRPPRCTECRSKMSQAGSLFVCPNCDRAPSRT